MLKQFNLRAPFFEIGPKVYLYGSQVVELAVFADGLVEKYGVDILFTAQYTDIEPIARRTSHIKVLAQHMDYVRPGRGLGSVLPEALVAAGANGVMLNHAEKPLALGVLNRTIKRADEVGLATVVCADTPEEAQAVAHLKPNVILAESPALIGVGKRTEKDAEEVRRVNESIWKIDQEIMVLHGAGISNEEDVFGVIACGAQGTGSTSGIMKADNPLEMTEKMIAAVRKAWQEIKGGKL
jgi:Triosephosphate isomerase